MEALKKCVPFMIQWLVKYSYGTSGFLKSVSYANISYILFKTFLSWINT